MKVNVYSINGKNIGSIELPSQFSEEIRPDLIKRAVLVIQSNNRQPYGSNPMAGKRTSAKHHARRKVYGTWANRGLSRLPRIRSGSGNLTGTARFAPHAVKGRKAHPPKAEKIWSQKINKKERKKAIRSAIASTAVKELIERRGHKVEDVKTVPIVLEDKFETLNKTKDIEKTLIAIGLSKELERTKIKKIRAGKGTTRGRKYRKKKGPLIVVNNDEKILKSAKNIPGVEVIKVKNLNAEALAPGTDSGRLTIWTKSAMKTLGKERLFE